MAVTARPTLAPMPSLANELPDCPTTKWSVDNIDIAAELFHQLDSTTSA